MAHQYSRRLFLAGASALVLAGCAREQAQASDDESRDLPTAHYVFANAATAPTLDPSLTDNLETNRIARQVLDGLVAPDAMTGDPVPALATAWSVADDELSWDFALRTDVVFHDGSAFNAEAVVRNFNRWAAASVRDATTGQHSLFDAVFRRGTPQGSSYQGCVAIDSHTVRILLTRPYPPLTKALTNPAFAMAAPSSIDAGTVGTSPVGTGPFEVAEGIAEGSGQRPGESVVLRASSRYWGELGPVGTLEFVAIPDTELRYVALQTDRVDGYDLVGLDAFAPLAREGTQVFQRDPYSVAYLGVHAESGPLAEINLREALMTAVDRQAIVRDHFPEGSSVAQEFLPARFNIPDAEVGYPAYSPQQARDIVSDSTYDGTALRFVYPTGASRQWGLQPEQLFADIAALLTRVGFEIEPVPVAWSVYSETIRTRSEDHDLFLFGSNGGFRDPDYFMATLFSAPTPQLGMDSETLRDLVDEAAAMADGDERQQVYRRVNARIMVEQAALPLAFPVSGVAVDSRTVSFPLNSTGFEEFNRLQLNED